MGHRLSRIVTRTGDAGTTGLGDGSRVAKDDPRIEALLLETRPSQGGDPATATQQRQLAVALCDGIDTLSDTLRTTLILVCVDGLGHEDAAKILGCPEGTVAWRVHEARRKLREYLASRGFGGEA